MLKKAALKAALKLWNKGGFSVQFWDGEEKSYGEEEPKFKIIFHREPKLSDIKDMNNDLVLTLGQAYMDGSIDFEGSLDDVIAVMFKNQNGDVKKYALDDLRKKMFSGIEEQERKNIHSHYDLGNDFYAKWLDKTMSYSCAYFKKPTDTLDEAQLNKIDHSLQKLLLKDNETLLDIGCGWGWLIIRAAQQYGVKAVGITLSDEQYAGATERIIKLGLQDKVKVLLLNYMDLDPAEYQFDKIVSIGMFEHVGKEFLPLYLNKVNTLLKDGGLFLLHSIMGYNEAPTNGWIKKYIFPGGYVPTVRETVSLFPDFNFYLLHMESLRRHYARTLDEWYKNFEACKDTLPEKYDEQFKRMWGLYLSGCAAAFRTGNIDVVQYLMSKGINNNLPMTNEYMYKK
ncbi:SAM-dependent methyltransferase [Pectinatus cerevisiiphilus]|uniref:Cyclopropane-fatty-acyl-phospholipid synthase n=1 Tax=Pectinatus cerevisiiphilus TaxID=86956 RepID=A0A4R3KFS7_9FIRM|nr:cyclopropane-fatty-acyl-phospholipid synthase family protein [Pectinatus cerevisiiphilus]TCS81859.1 cyclopropane-fatty-acyl-phospholipid synthase [Pectinatus cerevisiiphilus]